MTIQGVSLKYGQERDRISKTNSQLLTLDHSDCADYGYVDCSLCRKDFLALQPGGNRDCGRVLIQGSCPNIGLRLLTHSNQPRGNNLSMFRKFGKSG
jgi:hypothetical protein